MRTTMIAPRALFTGIVLLASAMSYVACGNSSDTTTSGNPQPVGGAGGGSSSSSVTGTGGQSSASTTSSGTTTGSSSSGAGGCIEGTPTTNDEYLNACNGMTCQHYDNSQLTMLSADGGLPALP